MWAARFLLLYLVQNAQDRGDVLCERAKSKRRGKRDLNSEEKGNTI